MFLLITAGLALFTGSVLYNGFTLMYLWAWFVVPFGLPPVTLPWSIGLCILISAVKGWPAGAQASDAAWLELLKPYAVATLCLALGWLVHGFM